ncbi:MAG TPA: M1 family peptidase, partial [Polyangiaceae bacterium]
MTRSTKLFESLVGIALFLLAGAVARAEVPALVASAAAPPAKLPENAAPPSAPSKAPARVASYVLSATLDGSAHTVKATGTITWRNASRLAVNELFVHLYMNAFKNQRSLFLRSPFTEGRSGAQAQEWGYVDVERLFARELGTDLWPAHAPGSPEDPDDET